MEMNLSFQTDWLKLDSMATFACFDGTSKTYGIQYPHEQKTHTAVQEQVVFLKYVVYSVN